MKACRRYRRFGRDGAKPAGLGPAAAAAEESRGPRQLIEQAARDISRGLRDTDLHGTPTNVPGPGPAPEQSPGAEVPPDGVNEHR